MISQATIEEIKNRMDIVEVVSDFVNLKRSGSSYKALSPFSTEKTPSFYVVPSKGIFKDFSSGKGGDAIRFLMEMDGLSYVDALKYLAQKYGVEIEEDEKTDEALQAQNKRESLYIILNFACEYFQDLLQNSEEGQSIGLSYFKERGFSSESIETFRLGYSLEQWDGLFKAATQKGYQPDLLEEAGLIIRKEEKTYDRFRGRVVFPIQNISGKVIAFGARILTNDKKQPKYINSPETELYVKTNVLYGLYQAKQAIRLDDNCFLVEGYTDVISMHQTGISNVVSSSGTALTEQQAKLIKRYASKVTVLFDGDAAGIRASLRGIDILLEAGLDVKAVTLPAGEDPDSLSKQLGTTAFKHFLVEKATDFIQFKTKVLLDDVSNDPIQKAGVIHEIVGSISKIGDPVKRSLYIKLCSNLMDISESVLYTEQNKLLVARSRKPFPERNINETGEKETVPIQEDLLKDIPEQLDIISYQEKESIRLLLNYGNNTFEAEGEEAAGKLVEYFLEELSTDLDFTVPIYKKIYELIAKRHADGLTFEIDYFMGIDDPELHQVVIELVAPRYEISESWKSKYHIHVPHEAEFIKTVAKSNIMRFKFRFVQQLIRQEQEKLSQAEGDDIDQIIEEIKFLKETEMEIARYLGNVTVK